MDYFIRQEHFDALGKLMLVVSMGWAYFFFNDYLVQWYGGDKFTDMLLHFHERGPLGWMWFAMLVFNVLIPWLTLWNKKLRCSPRVLFMIALLINVGMWFERYIIIPISLTINRMPFTWIEYVPRIELILGFGTLAFFILLYVIASRLIPLVPVWEVQEGQMAHTLRRIGRAIVPSVSEIE
jgi:Ni/Fe-hydrogenase subunit HybB-like protein